MSPPSLHGRGPSEKAEATDREEGNRSAAMPRLYDSPNLFREDILIRIQALVNQVTASQKRMQRLEQELGITDPPKTNDDKPDCE